MCDIEYIQISGCVTEYIQIRLLLIQDLTNDIDLHIDIDLTNERFNTLVHTVRKGLLSGSLGSLVD